MLKVRLAEKLVNLPSLDLVTQPHCDESSALQVLHIGHVTSSQNAPVTCAKPTLIGGSQCFQHEGLKINFTTRIRKPILLTALSDLTVLFVYDLSKV
jgi:hypothetical protein